jgi:hypothetical protein
MTQSIFELGQVADRAMNNDLNRHLDALTEAEELEEHWSEGIDECRDWIRAAEDALLVKDFAKVRQCMAELVMSASETIGAE